MSELHTAAGVGDVDAVKARLEAGDDLHATNQDGVPALGAALIPTPATEGKSNMEVVEVLLEAGAAKDIDTPYVNGETPFMIAVVEGNLDATKRLFEAGSPDVNRRYSNGNNLIDELGIKMKHRPRNMTITFTENGEEVTSSDPEVIREKTGSHPDDTTNRYLEIANFLLENGFDVASVNPNTQQTALFGLVGNDAPMSLLKAMVEKGAKVNLNDKSGLTPLHYAARNGFLPIMTFLIEQGADVNAQDDWGFTPLHEAALSGLVEATRCLLEAGADTTLAQTKDYDATYVAGTTPKKAAELKGRADVVAVYDAHEAGQAAAQIDVSRIPDAEWKWNETEQGHDGVRIENGSLLWYHHSENPHDGSTGAREQAIADYLVNGASAVQPPEEITAQLKKHIEAAA